METNLNEIRLCPKCGSTENFETENASGNSICTKCSCRTIKIPLRAITETEICSSRCTFCNKENNEEILSENGNIVIFKCEKCGVIDAYLIIDEPYNDVLNEEPYDGNYSFKTIKKAENEGNLVFSAPTYKEVAKAFKKKKRSPIEQNIKQLRQIIRNAK